MIRNPLVKKLCLFIIFTIVFFLSFAIYIGMHEYVHESNCEYHGFTSTRLDFTDVKCSGNNIDVANLDTINEMIGSIIFFVFLMVYSIMIWIVWR